MRMRADPASGYPGRTYRFYTGPKVYEFGYGLSYTKYSYKLLSLSHSTLHINQSSTHLMTQNSETIRYKLVSELAEETCQTMLLSIALGVTNRGNLAGKHPVLLFVRQGKVRNINNGNPVKQLVGFRFSFIFCVEFSFRVWNWAFFFFLERRKQDVKEWLWCWWEFEWKSKSEG